MNSRLLRCTALAAALVFPSAVALAQDATGAETPTGYTVTLNGNAVLRYLVRRVDPLARRALSARLELPQAILIEGEERSGRPARRGGPVGLPARGRLPRLRPAVKESAMRTPTIAVLAALLAAPAQPLAAANLPGLETVPPSAREVPLPPPPAAARPVPPARVEVAVRRIADQLAAGYAKRPTTPSPTSRPTTTKHGSTR